MIYCALLQCRGCSRIRVKPFCHLHRRSRLGAAGHGEIIGKADGVVVAAEALRDRFDIAVRDLEMAVAAFVLARMTEVRSEALGRVVVKERSAKAEIPA